MVHCCTFLVIHVMLFKVKYDVMPNNNTDVNIQG